MPEQRPEDVQPKAVASEADQPMLPSMPNRDAEEVVKVTMDGLMSLAEMMNVAPSGITDQDKSELMDIVKRYRNFIMNNLGAAPNEPVKKQQVSPQEAMNAAGNSNAQPAF